MKFSWCIVKYELGIPIFAFLSKNLHMLELLYSLQITSLYFESTEPHKIDTKTLTAYTFGFHFKVLLNIVIK